MHTFANPTVLLTLSVALSGVQARVARPRAAANLVCHEDNELRALERFSTYAADFCPEYLSSSEKPEWLNQWDSKKVSSACACFEKTATSLGVTSTTALAVMSTAPPILTAVFATPSVSAGGSPPSTGLPTGTGSVAAAYSAASSSAATVAASPVAATVSSELTPMSPSLPAGDTYPPQPFGAGPGKRGLAYDYKTQDGWSALFKGSKFATYGSNWGLDRKNLDASFSYVPTIGVDASLSNADWNASVPVLIEGGTKALLA